MIRPPALKIARSATNIAAWALSAPPDCDVTMLAMLPMMYE